MVAVAGGTAAVLSTCCPDSTGANEDSAAVIPLGPRSGVLAVADGMGGGRQGEAASRAAIGMLVSTLCAIDPSELLRSAILNGIEAANQAVRDLGGGAATTLVVVEIDEGAIRPYHVGDSKVLVLGGRGKLKLQTFCHAPIARAHQAGLMSETAALVHEDRCLVFNVVGEPDMRIEVGPQLKLAPRDTVVLGSDGLFDNLRLREIAGELRRGQLIEAVGRVASRAHQRMARSGPGPSKPDDLTLVAFRKNRVIPANPAHLSSE